MQTQKFTVPSQILVKTVGEHYVHFVRNHGPMRILSGRHPCDLHGYHASNDRRNRTYVSKLIAKSLLI